MPLNLDRMMYLVISDYKGEPYICEANLSRANLTTVCKDVMHGQYDPVLAVIEINPIEHICREVTDDFKTLLADRCPDRA